MICSHTFGTVSNSRTSRSLWPLHRRLHEHIWVSSWWLETAAGGRAEFLLSDSLQRLVRLVRWKNGDLFLSWKYQNQITVCPIGHAGNMYKLPKQKMFYVLVTGPDQLPKIIVLATYRLWVLKDGPKSFPYLQAEAAFLNYFAGSGYTARAKWKSQEPWK